MHFIWVSECLWILNKPYQTPEDRWRLSPFDRWWKSRGYLCYSLAQDHMVSERAVMPRAASRVIVPYSILKSLPLCCGLSVLQWFMQVWYLLSQGCWTSSAWPGWLLQTLHHVNVAILLPWPAWVAEHRLPTNRSFADRDAGSGPGHL